jgi:hypothetical protein
MIAIYSYRVSRHIFRKSHYCLHFLFPVGQFTIFFAKIIIFENTQLSELLNHMCPFLQYIILQGILIRLGKTTFLWWQTQILLLDFKIWAQFPSVTINVGGMTCRREKSFQLQISLRKKPLLKLAPKCTVQWSRYF